jgi:hypothetical protein
MKNQSEGEPNASKNCQMEMSEKGFCAEINNELRVFAFRRLFFTLEWSGGKHRQKTAFLSY